MSDYPWLPEQLLREGNSYVRQLAFLTGAPSVLEIGCATGAMSRQLAARGHRVVGVERNPTAASQARAACAEVIVGDIEDRKLQADLGARFDAVLLADVLEHLIDPGAVLAAARGWLRPGGRVVVSVPNAGHWIFRREVLLGRFPYRGSGLFDRGHLRFFTRDSLRRLVTESGYGVDGEAASVNRNAGEDLTFASLGWLYSNRPDFRQLMIRAELALLGLRPTLFAYQFILRLSPRLGAAVGGGR